MITTALIDYIKNQNNKNVSREMIISRLAQAGWRIEDIEEGLIKAIPPVENKTTTPATEIKKEYTIDPYHEPVDSNVEPLAVKIEQPKIDPEIKKESQKIWTPQAVKPVEEIEVKEEQPIIKPVSTRTLETFPAELNKKLEPSKPAFVKPIVKEIKSIKEETDSIPTLTPKPLQVLQNETAIGKKDGVLSWNFPPQSQPQVETGTITPQVENIIVPPMAKIPEIGEVPEISEVPQVAPSKIPEISDGLSKKAMISSYAQDYMSANKIKQEVTKRRRNTLLKILIIILIICVLGGIAFVFAEDYIKISNFNIPFVKKDSKTLLLNSSVNFSNLNSYKVDTKIILSSPSFANITSGLMGGEAINSNDKDSFSLKADGKVNKTQASLSLYDYDVALNSSMLKNEIKTNFKYDGGNSYIDVPDLNSILGDKAPVPGIVLIPNEKIGQISNLLPVDIKRKTNNIDLTKLLPGNTSSFLSNQFALTFRDFINNAKMIKKGEQTIYDVSTYQYSVSVEKESFKRLLNDISGIIFVNLSEDQKNNLTETLAAVSVNSFEVWIGKKDDIVYQYKFTLTIPLSKVIGLEDKGIANNEVVLDWQTTYYELDTPNAISIPQGAVSLENFIKNMQDINIKNVISSFSSSAQTMKNALGNYGSKPNTTGSCTEPVPGSLFSPLGHSKGASTVVGTIASTMNTIVSQTTGVPACYSTSKAWAIASPLASDGNSYFCLDSTGSSVILATPLTKTVCQ